MSKYFLGLDIGGTKIACGLVSQNGKVIKKIKFLTGKKVSDGIDNIISAINKICGDKIYPIGIGCAGQIDIKYGKIIYSPNMPAWKNISLLKILRQKLGKNFEIKIDNDANCFTLAESKFGAGRGFKNIIGLTLGTGIGSGAILDGKFFHGVGNAPELGHQVIEINGRKCGCGKLGHLEAYSSGRAIEKQYLKLTGKKLQTTDIEKKFYQGDFTAKKVFNEAKKYLAAGIANIIINFDPEIIIFGGSIGIKSKLIYQGLGREVKKNLFFKDKKINIKKAKLSQDAGIIGAALLNFR